MTEQMKPRILIKIGGRAFEGREGFVSLAEAIRAAEGAEFIIVHGGGREISKALRKAKRDTAFVDGIRVTPAEDIQIVEDVLSGTINQRIAAFLNESGVSCRRLSGKIDHIFIVEPLIRQGRSLGYVGEIKDVNARPVMDSLESGCVPVVSPISSDRGGTSYNVNADSAAAALAVASQCSDLVYLSDVPGVRLEKTILRSLTIEEAQRLVADGTIKGGMVAKIESACEALEGHVKRVHVTQWHGRDTLANIVKNAPTPGTVIRL
jgi:acetylglutamate kinase